MTGIAVKAVRLGHSCAEGLVGRVLPPSGPGSGAVVAIRGYRAGSAAESGASRMSYQSADASLAGVSRHADGTTTQQFPHECLAGNAGLLLA